MRKRRQEARGKRQEARGKRQEARGKRQREREGQTRVGGERRGNRLGAEGKVLDVVFLLGQGRHSLAQARLGLVVEGGVLFLHEAVRGRERQGGTETRRGKRGRQSRHEGQRPRRPSPRS